MGSMTQPASDEEEMGVEGGSGSMQSMMASMQRPADREASEEGGAEKETDEDLSACSLEPIVESMQRPETDAGPLGEPFDIQMRRPSEDAGGHQKPPAKRQKAASDEEEMGAEGGGGSMQSMMASMQRPEPDAGPVDEPVDFEMRRPSEVDADDHQQSPVKRHAETFDFHDALSGVQPGVLRPKQGWGVARQSSLGTAARPIEAILRARTHAGGGSGQYRVRHRGGTVADDAWVAAELVPAALVQAFQVRMAESAGKPAAAVAPAAAALPREARSLAAAALRRPDAVLRPDVLPQLQAWGRGGGAPEEAASLLAAGYRGYPVMVNMLAGWVDNTVAAIGGADVASEVSEPVARAAGRSEALMVTRLSLKLLAVFDVARFDALLDDATGPPAWLHAMLADERWHQLFRGLAAKHPSSLLLAYTQEVIDGGGRGDAAHATAALTLPQFAAELEHRLAAAVAAMVVAAAGGGAVGEWAVGAAEPVASGQLHRFAAASEHGYLLVQHALLSLGAAGSGGQVAAASRLRQDLEEWARAGSLGDSGGAAAGAEAARRRGHAPHYASLAGGGSPRVLAEAEEAAARAKRLGPREVQRLHAALEAEDDGQGQPLLGWLRHSGTFFRAAVATLFQPEQHSLSQGEVRLLAEVLAAASVGDDRRPRAVGVADALLAARACCMEVSQLRRHARTVPRRAIDRGWLTMPAVAASLLHWAAGHVDRAAVSIDTSNAAVLQALLALAMEVAAAQPLLLPAAAALVDRLFRLDEGAGVAKEGLDVAERLQQASVAAATGIDLKRNCVDVLLAFVLGSAGRAATPEAQLLPLRLARRWAQMRRVDESLLRYLVAEVAAAVAPPFSPPFVRAFAELLGCSLTIAALRGAHAKKERRLVSAWLEAAQSCGLEDTIRLSAVLNS
jgi:hypothetical protein